MKYSQEKISPLRQDNITQLCKYLVIQSLGIRQLLPRKTYYISFFL